MHMLLGGAPGTTGFEVDRNLQEGWGGGGGMPGTLVVVVGGGGRLENHGMLLLDGLQ